MQRGRSRRSRGAGARRVVAPLTFRGHTLDEFQVEAVIALQQETTTLVSAPTGTGKTLIADFLVDDSLRRGRRVVYTAPLKALVNQKYRDFRAAFGGANAGIMTGDVTENPKAPLLVMTTEVLRNMLLQRAAAPAADADWIVFDEIHYINHPERGTVWEEAIMLLPPGLRLLGLSATVPNIRELAAWLEQITGEPVAVIVHEERAVPLRHYYFTGDGQALTYGEVWERLAGGDLKGETLDAAALADEWPPELPSPSDRRAGRSRRAGRAPSKAGAPRPRRRRSDDADLARHLDVIGYVSRERLFPCIYFAFSRRTCEAMARDLARRRNFLRPYEREAVHVTVRQILHQAGLRARDVPGLSAMQQMWYKGVGVHHAGLVPIVKHIVEHLLERRILRVVYATETFAVGVNMPVRTVCFDEVAKFDGTRFRLLTQHEFLQMAGRAGRRGLDEAGTVLIRTDAETMAAAGWRDWEKASLEPITSHLSLSYTTVLNLLDTLGPDQVRAWLAKSLFVRQSDDRSAAAAALAAAVEKKAAELRRLGYLNADEAANGEAALTAKGAFCRHIWVKELLTTELAFDGTLAELDAAGLAGWAAAMVWESRPQDAAMPPAAPKWVSAVQLNADRIMRWTGPKSRPSLLTESRVAPLLERWAAAGSSEKPLSRRYRAEGRVSGENLEQLLRGYPLEAGDFVALCRQVVDFLRQIAAAARHVVRFVGDDAPEAVLMRSVRANALAAIDAVDRDVVAASRAL